MMGKLRYVFWSIVASGALMVVSSLFGNKDTKMMLQLVGATKRAMPAAVAERLPASDSDSEPVMSPNAPAVAGETEDAEQVSSSANEYVIDNDNYVLIQGKYYKASPDNIYYVNGQKIYYVNNRRTQGVQANIKQALDEPRQTASSGAFQPTATDEQSVATSPAAMYKTLLNTQQKIKERDEALKELEK